MFPLFSKGMHDEQKRRDNRRTTCNNSHTGAGGGVSSTTDMHTNKPPRTQHAALPSSPGMTLPLHGCTMMTSLHNTMASPTRDTPLLGSQNMTSSLTHQTQLSEQTSRYESKNS